MVTKRMSEDDFRGCTLTDMINECARARESEWEYMMAAAAEAGERRRCHTEVKKLNDQLLFLLTEYNYPAKRIASLQATIVGMEKCRWDVEASLADRSAEIQQLVRERDGWMDTCRQQMSNTDFYRGIVRIVGEFIGHEAYVSDDGSVQQDVLALKVPELVQRLKMERDCAMEGHNSIKERWEEWSKEKNAEDDCTTRIVNDYNRLKIENKGLKQQNSNLGHDLSNALAKEQKLKAEFNKFKEDLKKNVKKAKK